MTITSITIENFKGIRDRVTIDLKPITLLFGPNSAGKSTIIQALHYAWEVIGRHNLDPNFTEFGGKEMDLGGFENLVHGHDLSRSISIRFDMDLIEEPLSIYGDKEEVMKWQLPYADEDLDGMLEGSVPILRWNIGKKDIFNAWIEFKISWSEPNAKFQVTSYEVGFNNEMISKIKIVPDSGKVKIVYINFFHPLLIINKDECESDCEWLNNLLFTYAKEMDNWLDKDVFPPETYEILVDAGNSIKEFSSLDEELKMYKKEVEKCKEEEEKCKEEEEKCKEEVEKCKEEEEKCKEEVEKYKEVDDSDYRLIINNSLEKLPDEKLRQKVEFYGHKNIKRLAREDMISFVSEKQYAEKVEQYTKKLEQNLKMLKQYNEKVTQYTEKMKQYNEKTKQYNEKTKQYNNKEKVQIREKVKPFLPYEFFLMCLEVFGKYSIKNDLSIECFGLIDALPKTEETFRLDLKSKSFSGLIEEISYENALDSAIKQFILGPLDILRIELEKLHYLGPIRNRIPRNYIPNRYIENRNWPDGLAAWDVLHKEDEEIVSQTDHWMADRLNSGYHISRKTYKEIDVSKVTARNKGLAKQYNSTPTKTRLYLMDQKSGVELQPPDVGVGISQVIPVIVSALYFKDGIVSIEQPELHIHPALQVTLGDLFIEQIKKNPDLTFILETHSEHLLLRFLRRIRETFEGELPAGVLSLSPGEMSIYYIATADDQVKVSELKISEDGDSANSWPTGFFEERHKELY